MKPEVPEDWAVRPIDSVAEVLLSNVDKKSSSDEIPVRLCNYMDVYGNAQITADLPFMEATATTAQVEKFGLRVSDVLITKDSEDPSDIAVPSVVVDAFDGPVVCGYHLAILRPHTIDGQYLSWALRSRPVNDQFRRRANGSTRFGLTNDVIRSALIPFPPLPEQRKIAAILSSVEEAIAATRKVIEQTERVKQGLLQTLMVRGIGHTKFQNTQIGEIPHTWAVRPLHELLESRVYGISSSLSTEPMGTPILRMGNLKDGRLDLSDLKYADVSAIDPARAIVRRGDILFNRTNSIDLVGRSALVETDLELGYASYLVRLRPKTSVDPRWLASFMNSSHGQRIIRKLAKRSVSQANINPTALGRSHFPVPPLDEQQAIADAIDALRDNADRAVCSAGALGAVKRGLLQNLLTGRVRVQPD